jgi:hypothetical protein
MITKDALESDIESLFLVVSVSDLREREKRIPEAEALKSFAPPDFAFRDLPDIISSKKRIPSLARKNG